MSLIFNSALCTAIDRVVDTRAIGGKVRATAIPQVYLAGSRDALFYAIQKWVPVGKYMMELSDAEFELWLALMLALNEAGDL